MLEIYIKQNGAGALPKLQEAALSAKDNGPFDVIITQMNNAVQPGLGETMSDESRTAFEDAIISIAKDVPEKALFLAQQLNSVESKRSGELLKIIYADRLSEGVGSVRTTVV